MYIHGFSAYTGEPNVAVQRLKEEISGYTRVNFRRANRFILLALLGACQCIQRCFMEPDTAIYLTTEHGNLGETAAVLDEIYTARSLPKPYGFINTMSGTAAFYLAQALGSRGRNITVSSQHLSFERGLELLQLDFAFRGKQGAGESSRLAHGRRERLVLCQAREGGGMRVIYCKQIVPGCPLLHRVDPETGGTAVGSPCIRRPGRRG
jgi:hypothetical protein